MLDNFEQIKGLLNFESGDDFYFAQILQRKKENIELGSNSHVVKTYFIRSVEELEFHKGEMICLAEYHNARVYLNLNKRSFEQIAFQNLRKITDIIMNKDYKSVRKSYSSVCGNYCSDKKRKWIIDVNDKSINENEFIEAINAIRPEGEKFVAKIKTKNGYHLIVTAFDMQAYRNFKLPVHDIQKDNPTLLYIP